jgi:hypothetical protein
MQIPKHELEMVWAMDDGELAKIRALYDAHEDLRNSRDSGGLPWLVPAVKAPRTTTLEFVLTLGYDINAVGVPPYGSVTALQIAIGKSDLGRTKILLDAGASPNVERPVLACMSTRFSADRQIEFLSLLLPYGADLNRLYDLYGDTTKCFSALDFAPNAAVRKFLLGHDALPSYEIKARSK